MLGVGNKNEEKITRNRLQLLEVLAGSKKCHFSSYGLKNTGFARLQRDFMFLIPSLFPNNELYFQLVKYHSKDVWEAHFKPSVFTKLEMRKLI